jgi:CelD/BcsL family acetyltransferase involved in cellulose biosynthesis
LAGLGETGDDSDIALLERALYQPLAKGRASAVRALRMLGAATPDRVTNLLEDTSAAVTRQVAKALVTHAKELDRAFLERLVQPTRPRHVRVAAYRLLRDREVWTRLSTDLQFVSDTETAISVRARADLDVWLKRDAATTYARPAGAEAERIGRLLDQSENSLSPRTLKELRFHLGLPRTSTV